LSKVLVEKENDENVLGLRNLIYKFCKIHHYKVKMIINPETHIITFKLEDEKNES